MARIIILQGQWTLLYSLWKVRDFFVVSVGGNPERAIVFDVVVHKTYVFMHRKHRAEHELTANI